MRGALPRRLAREAIRLANWLVDGAVLSAVVLIVSFTAYAVLDNGRVSRQATTEVFEQYRPTAEGASLDELRELNPDVLGWLTLYGTGIDYPLVQGKDNDAYINTNAAGEFALSGALFLDWRNAPDFSDASTVVFGHHMENSLMFGDLDKYADEGFLREHRTGSLWYGGLDHGIEVLAYLPVDAYDPVVYSTTVGASPTREEFVSYLREKATVWVGDPSEEDHLVVLSTCGSGTNDRHVVIARICDDVFANPYEGEAVSRTLAGTAEGVAHVAWVIAGVAAFLLMAWVFGAPRTRRDERGGGQ